VLWPRMVGAVLLHQLSIGVVDAPGSLVPRYAEDQVVVSLHRRDSLVGRDGHSLGFCQPPSRGWRVETGARGCGSGPAARPPRGSPLAPASWRSGGSPSTS